MDDQKIKKFKGSMAITKVGRDGVLILTLFGQQGSKQLAQAIDNKTIEFSIITRKREKINFTIISHHPLNSEVKI